MLCSYKLFSCVVHVDTVLGSCFKRKMFLINPEYCSCVTAESAR